MAIILPESYGNELAFSADEALHPEFWEPYRPVSAFCPLLGPTGNRLIDYAGGSPMTIQNYASSMWKANGLKFDGTTQYAIDQDSGKFSNITSLCVFCNIDATNADDNRMIAENGTYYNANTFFIYKASGGITFLVHGTSGTFENLPIPGILSSNPKRVLALEWRSGRHINGWVDSTNYIGSGTIQTDLLSGNKPLTIGCRPSDPTPSLFYNGIVKYFGVYVNGSYSDAWISNITRLLKQDPLAPFRKRPVRRFFKFDTAGTYLDFTYATTTNEATEFDLSPYATFEVGLGINEQTSFTASAYSTFDVAVGVDEQTAFELSAYGTFAVDTTTTVETDVESDAIATFVFSSSVSASSEFELSPYGTFGFGVGVTHATSFSASAAVNVPLIVNITHESDVLISGTLAVTLSNTVTIGSAFDVEVPFDATTFTSRPKTVNVISEPKPNFGWFKSEKQRIITPDWFKRN